MPYTQGINVDTIYTVWVHSRIVVEEYLFHTTFHFCESAGSCHEPAISYGALAYIHGVNSVGSPEGIVGIQIIKTLEGDAIFKSGDCSEFFR